MKFDRALHFYRGALEALGYRIEQSGEDWFEFDELYVSSAASDTPPTHIHLAFQAHDRAQVDAFYRACLEAGGKDNGAPGEREYHPGYYAAFVLDPDGNNIEAVFHGETRRSASSVTIESKSA